jgi:hypothetical protein
VQIKSAACRPPFVIVRQQWIWGMALFSLCSELEYKWKRYCFYPIPGGAMWFEKIVKIVKYRRQKLWIAPLTGRHPGSWSGGGSAFP